MPIERDDAGRFEPRAARAMAAMFDGVTGRYDLLNRLMTLGRDQSWRRAMWRAVPENARAVLDLCTGTGVSLAGLRRPGRLVLGVDVSLGMLEIAADEQSGPGWSPRLVCSDAFRLPVRDRSLDAVTIAFGVRNLRPRAEALDEIARVLKPGGVLVVLEATAPRPGPFAPLHRLHLRHGIALLGRLSPDPSAYRYLGDSILEFGDGDEWERSLAGAGFEVRARHRFLLGASALWVASRGARRGEKPSAAEETMQSAREAADDPGEFAHPERPSEREARLWLAVQTVVSGLIFGTVLWAMVSFFNLGRDMGLEAWQKQMGWGLLGLAAFAFGARTLALIGRLRDRAPWR